MKALDNAGEAGWDVDGCFVGLDFTDFVEFFDAGAGLDKPLYYFAFSDTYVVIRYYFVIYERGNLIVDLPSPISASKKGFTTSNLALLEKHLAGCPPHTLLLGAPLTTFLSAPAGILADMIYINSNDRTQTVYKSEQKDTEGTESREN